MQGIKYIVASHQNSLRGLVYITVGLLLLGWMLNTPAGFLGKADAVGYAVCHRISSRSFHLGERALPLCARCSGMYLGAVLGLTYQFIVSRRKAGLPPRKVLWILVVFVIAFVFDGINSFLSIFPSVQVLYTPHNWIRLATGTGIGLAMAALLYPAFNQTVWGNWKNEPAVRGLLSFTILIVLSAGMNLLILTGNPIILYPAALISAAGVLMILTMVYSMLLLIMSRNENQYTFFHQLSLPLAAGFGLGIFQIAVLSIMRYAITGTWDGFHLG